MTPHGKQAKPTAGGGRTRTIHQRIEPASQDDDGARVYELPNGERLIGWEWDPDRPDEPPWPITNWEAIGFGPESGEDGAFSSELQGLALFEHYPEDQDDEVAKDEHGTKTGPRFVIGKKSPIIGFRVEERPVSGEGTAGDGKQAWQQLGLGEEWKKRWKYILPNVERYLAEGRYDRLPLHRPGRTSTLERYIDGSIVFHVHLDVLRRHRRRAGEHVEARQHCVLFEGPVDDLVLARLQGARGADADAVARDIARQRHRMKKAVLIDVAQFLQLEEGERRGILPSVVRLQSLDDCRRVLIDSGELWLARPPEGTTVLADWKGSLPREIVREGDGMPLGQGVDEVVERGPELVDALSDENADLQGDGLHVYGPQDYPAAVRVELGTSYIGLRIDESLYGLVEHMEALPSLSEAALDCVRTITHALPSPHGPQAEDRAHPQRR